MPNIPLYNCYWCKCAWCLRKSETECFEKCCRCHSKDKFKMPVMDCDRFLEKTTDNKKLYAELQKCSKCKYKKLFKIVKRDLEDLSL